MHQSHTIHFFQLLPMIIIMDPSLNLNYASALKCYQSQSMIQTPLTQGMGEAQECANGQSACTILLNFTAGVVSRGCALDCSTSSTAPISGYHIPNNFNADPFCVNFTISPREFCCCQLDLCNALPTTGAKPQPKTLPQPSSSSMGGATSQQNVLPPMRAVVCDSFFYTNWSAWAPPVCVSGIVQMRVRQCTGSTAPACLSACTDFLTQQHPCDGW